MKVTMSNNGKMKGIVGVASQKLIEMYHINR